jgi:hypothetical protein
MNIVVPLQLTHFVSGLCAKKIITLSKAEETTISVVLSFLTLNPFKERGQKSPS